VVSLGNQREKWANGSVEDFRVVAHDAGLTVASTKPRRQRFTGQIREDNSE
jgi:hypothetical protein